MRELERDDILDMIESNDGPEGLNLSGKNLSGINLGREAIYSELANRGLKSAIWLDAAVGGVNLKSIALDKANLESSKLGKANLERGSFVEANLKSAYLRGANLQEAVLLKANLFGAKLDAAQMESANLYEADLQSAEMWGTNLKSAQLSRTNLKAADLGGAILESALLGDANLQSAVLWRANLKSANLKGAHLESARLWEANLTSASLRRCNLENADLRQANLDKVDFYGAFLNHTQMVRAQLGDKVVNEEAGSYDEARDVYLRIKQNFDSLGDYSAASWAYVKERQMRRAWHRKKGKWGEWLLDMVAELSCKYGESLRRVVACMVILVVGSALVYRALNGVIAYAHLSTNFWDYLLYALSSSVTMELDHIKPANATIEAISRFQAILGIILAGLLGFVAGNKTRRS